LLSHEDFSASLAHTQVRIELGALAAFQLIVEIERYLA